MTETSTQVATTGLYINGESRTTPETMPIADPAKPDAVAGYAAAASKDDVADAVAAAPASA